MTYFFALSCEEQSQSKIHASVYLCLRQPPMGGGAGLGCMEEVLQDQAEKLCLGLASRGLPHSVNSFALKHERPSCAHPQGCWCWCRICACWCDRLFASLFIEAASSFLSQK